MIPPSLRLWRGTGAALTLCARCPMGDDFVLDAVVGGLRNYLAGEQVPFRIVGPAVNDLLRIGCSDARECIELVLGGAVDVDLLTVWSFAGACAGRCARRSGLSRLGWIGCRALGQQDGRGEGQEQQPTRGEF